MCRNPLPMILVLAAGCGGGVTLIDPPPPPPAGPTSLRFLPETEDLAAAQALGWEAGIPDAEVTVTPVDSSAPPRVVMGNETGVVNLSDLVAGVTYWVDVRRWLTPEERSRLPALEDVLGWVTRTSVAAGSGEIAVRVLASRKHGFVISEWYFNYAAIPPVTQTYYYGGFVELLNNADTTLYLDGLTIVDGLAWAYDSQGDNCAFFAPYSNDADGIWTRQVQQFPGRGRDHPVPPGGTVVVAQDAIDHTAIIQGGLDLRSADFEFYGGSGDVDNPAVPNMIDTLSLASPLTGHAPTYESILALARPYNRSTAPRAVVSAGKEWIRVDRSLLVDVVSVWSGWVPLWPRCPRLINAGLDRASFDQAMNGWNENVEFLHSASRVEAQALGFGRPILQWTRSSAADFVRTSRTPGLVR